MYLLDTNVISETRRSRPHSAVVAWIASVPDHLLFVPAVAIGEIQAGIERARATDPAKADEISAWLDRILETSQVVVADAEVFRLWGRLVARTPDGLLVDELIAAMALCRGMTVVTRNTRDFAGFGVACLDPFAASGPGTRPISDPAAG